MAKFKLGQLVIYNNIICKIFAIINESHYDLGRIEPPAKYEEFKQRVPEKEINAWDGMVIQKV